MQNNSYHPRPNGVQSNRRYRYIQYRSNAIQPQKQNWILIGLIISFAAAFLPWFLLLSSFLFFQISGLILPGVHVSNINLGGMTKTRASQILNRTWNQEKLLTVSDGSQVWVHHPYDFGIWLDADQTADHAYQIGRTDHPLITYLNTIFYHHAITPVVLFLPQYADLSLASMKTIVNRPSEENRLKYENDEWTLEQGVSGQELDIPATLNKLATHATEIINSQQLVLITKKIPAQSNFNDEDLKSVLDQLNKPMYISAYDPIKDEEINWDVSPSEFAPWIRITPLSDSNDISLSIDPTLFNNYLIQLESDLTPDQSIQKEINISDLNTSWKNGNPIELIIHHKPTSYTVQTGDTLESIGYRTGMPYWKILDANPDISMNRLTAGEQINIPSKNEMIPLPVVKEKRIIISLAQQRLWTYENGKQRSEHTISTGIASSPTHPGVFQIQTHEKEAYASVWDLYMPHFLGIYEGWPGFMNGIHGLPTLSNGTILWANVLGRPASYGCIILNLKEAEDLFLWAENGVIVEIRPD